MLKMALGKTYALAAGGLMALSTVAQSAPFMNENMWYADVGGKRCDMVYIPTESVKASFTAEGQDIYFRMDFPKDYFYGEWLITTSEMPESHVVEVVNNLKIEQSRAEVTPNIHQSKKILRELFKGHEIAFVDTDIQEDGSILRLPIKNDYFESAYDEFSGCIKGNAADEILEAEAPLKKVELSETKVVPAVVESAATKSELSVKTVKKLAGNAQSQYTAVYFDVNGANVEYAGPDIKGRINKIVKYVQTNDYNYINVAGRMDHKENGYDQLTIAKQRVDNVVTHLIERGVDPERINRLVHGGKKQSTNEYPLANRSVILKVY